MTCYSIAYISCEFLAFSQNWSIASTVLSTDDFEIINWYLLEKEKINFLQWSIMGYINHTPGQTPWLEVVDQYKMDFTFIYDCQREGYCFVLEVFCLLVWLVGLVWFCLTFCYNYNLCCIVLFYGQREHYVVWVGRWGGYQKS